jgi:hypothetical protein
MALGGADATLRYRITADDDSNVVFKKAGDNLRVLDQRFDKTSKGAFRLGNQFEDTKKRLSSLNDQFAKTGDVKLLKEINKAERDLSRLSAWQKRFKGDTDDSSKSLNVFSRSARNAGERIREALPKSGIFSPTILGATATAAAIAAIPAGAVITGAALAGLGLGFVGLGAAAVRNSAKVKTAFADLSGAAEREFTRAGASMEKPIVGALNILRGTVQAVGPDLREMFDDTAPHVEGLARGVDGLVRRTMPGLKRAVSESGGVLDTLSAKLPETGDALSDFFDNLADGSEGGGKALSATLGLINTQIGFLGGLLEGTAKSFDFFTGSGVFAGGTMGILADQMSKTSEANKKVTAEAKSTGQGFSTLAASTNMSKAAAEAHERANLNLADSMRNVQNTALSLAGSEISAIDARVRMNAELKDGAKSLDVNTAAGRANKQSILDGVSAAIRYGEAETKRTGSANAGAAAQQRHTDAMYRNAVAVLGDKAAVDRLWASLGLLPPVKVTKVSAPGAVPAKTQVDAFNTAVNRILPKKGTQTYTNAPNTKAQVEALERAINRVPTFHSTTFYTLRINESRRVFSGPANTDQFRQHGGPVLMGQPYVVGEKRAEVFVPEVNGRILPSVPAAMSRPSVGTPGRRTMATGATTVVHNHYHLNAGVVGSQMELKNWFVRMQDDAKRSGRGS